MTQGVYRHKHQQNRKQKNVPGRRYLRKAEEPVPYRYRLHERCQCPTNRGRWLVLWGRQFYFIEPATQLQKDIWLGDASRKIGEEKALACLRWFCSHCGITQLP